MKTSKILLSVSIISLIFYTTCTTFDPSMLQKKPTVTYKNFQFKEITLNDMTVLLSLEVENPYPVTLYAESIQSQIYIDTFSLFSIQSKDTLKLPKNSKTDKTFAVTITYEQLLKAVKEYHTKDSITMTVKGTISFSLPPSIQIVQSISVPFTIKQEIPTIKPSIDIVNFKIIPPTLSDLKNIVKNVNPLEIPTLYTEIQNFCQGKSMPESISKFDIPLSIAFDIIIKNKTKAILSGKSINYNFILHDSEIAKGQPTIQNTDGVSKINCMTTLSTKHISKGFMQAITQKNIQYSMKGDMLFNATLKGTQMPVPFAIEQQGNIKW
ncbi:MAG: LEA type 2 family protein [Spirochaetes bacterium]|nr:LEA type 2 family protein [Spirochaetota bacterium]